MSDDEDIDITDPSARFGVQRKTLSRPAARRPVEESSSSSSSESSDVSSTSSSDSDADNSDDDSDAKNKAAEDEAEARGRFQREYEQSLKKKAEEQVHKMVEDDDPYELQRRQLRAKVARANQRFVEVDDEIEIASSASSDSESSEVKRIRAKKQKLLASVNEDDESELGDTKPGKDDGDSILDEGSEQEEELEDEDEDAFAIKFSWRVQKNIKADPDKPIGEALQLYIETLPEKDRSLKFTMKFDGDPISAKKTPAELGIESGDQVDVIGK